MVDTVLNINWAFYKNLCVCDIHKKARNRACKYMLDYFQNNDLIQILYKFNNTEAKETNLIHIINHILENDCSIMVIDRTTDEIKAVALLQWITSQWRTWTATRLIVQCPLMSDLFELMHQVFNEYEEAYSGMSNEYRDTLHIFFFRVNDDLLSDSCFMKIFFNAICEVARHMNMSQVTYVALSNYDRSIISAYNFADVAIIMYSMFLIRKRRRPFDRLRDINEMNATLYVRQIEPLIPYQDIIVRHGHLSTKEVPKKKERRTTTFTSKIGVEQPAEDD